VGFGDVGRDLALGAQGQGVGQVFLDGDRRAVLIVGQIDDGEAAQRELPLDPVVVEQKTGGRAQFC
jgi:hypothetical protein